MIDLAFAALRSTVLILAGLAMIALFMRRRSAAARHHALRVLLVAALVVPMVTLTAHFTPHLVTVPVSAQAVQAAPTWVPATAMPAQSYRLRKRSAPVSDSAVMVAFAPIGLWFFPWFGIFFVLSLPAQRAWKRLQRIEIGATELEPFDGIPVLRAVDPQLRVPVAYGRKPGKILLPADSKDWSEERLQPALRHEAAHIRRDDPLWIAFGRGFATIYWFSPGFFLLASALRDTGEEAADDAVLASGIRPSDYARELLAVAHRTSGLDAAAVAMVGRVGLRGRIAAILSPRRDRRHATVALGVVAGMAFSLVTLGIAGVGCEMKRLTMPLRAGAVEQSGPDRELADGTRVFLTSVESVTMDRIVAWNDFGGKAEFKKGELPVSVNPDGSGRTFFHVAVDAPEPNAGVTFRFPAPLGGVGTSSSGSSDTTTTLAYASVSGIDSPALSTDVLVGVATGPWRREPITPLARSAREIDVDRPGTVEFPVPSDDLQWNVTVYSGNTPIPVASTNGRQANFRHACIAVDLKPGQRIDRVVLSTRPYRWAVFRDVSLHPGRDALAKARRPKLRRSVGWDGRIVSYEVVGTEAAR